MQLLWVPHFQCCFSGVFPFNPIPTSHGRNQPIYECHMTTVGRNRVKRAKNPMIFGQYEMKKRSPLQTIVSFYFKFIKHCSFFPGWRSTFRCERSQFTCFQQRPGSFSFATRWQLHNHEGPI